MAATAAATTAELAPARGAIRPSACPGLVRVVATGDGGLCRVRLTGGHIDALAARALAAAAREHGSGELDATNRANLQIRGVKPGHEAALATALIAAGLGPFGAGTLDHATSRGANPGTRGDTPPGTDPGPRPGTSARVDLADAARRDDVRNVMLSPSAGRDPGTHVDTRALGHALLAMLQTEPRFAALSPKCSVLVDGGERLAALDHPHDLWLAAIVEDAAAGPHPASPATAAAARGTGAPRYALGLAGRPPVAASDTPALATVSGEQAVALVHALFLEFVETAPPDAKRFRDALATLPAHDWLARAAARLDDPLAVRCDAALAHWRRAAPEPQRRFGIAPERDPATRQVGAQVPLGRLDAAQLDALAALAERDGDGSLIFTPWQGVLLPAVPAARAPATLAALEALGLVGSADAPLGRLVACAGSTGCARALADTKADARALAARLHAPADLHVSGCARACAQPWPAPATLVALGPGRYDLYLRDGEHGFGRLAARHLTIDQAAAALGAPRHPQD